MADRTLAHQMQLSGPVTLYESNEIRDSIMAILADKVPLSIDMSTSGPWDLSGLQLLIGAVASFEKKGLSLRFVEVPQSCSEIAERAGLLDWLKLHTDSFH
jgi:anti-anti-sigma regulatory factor